MSDFATTAALETVVDEASLRTAEQTIAERLGNVTVHADATPRAAPDGGATPTARSLSRRPKTRTGPSATGGTTAGEPDTSTEVLVELLEVQESALEELEDINGGGGGLFGEGGVLEFVTGTATDVAGEAAGTTADVVGGIAGPAIGTAIGETLSGYLPGGDDGDGTVDLNKPDWVPLPAEDVDDIGVTEPDWIPLELDKPEWEVTVDKPEWEVTVDKPSWRVDVNKPDWKIEVEEAGPIAVDAPESIPVNVPMAQMSNRNRPPGDIGPAPPLEGAPLSRHITKGAQEGGDAVPVLGQAYGAAVGAITPLFNGIMPGTEQDIVPGNAGYRGNPESNRAYNQIREQRQQQWRERYYNTGSDPEPRRVDDVNITVEYDIELGDITIEDIDHRELRREIEREQEKQREDAIRKLKRQFRR